MCAMPTGFACRIAAKPNIHADGTWLPGWIQLIFELVSLAPNEHNQYENVHIFVIIVHNFGAQTGLWIRSPWGGGKPAHGMDLA